VQVLQAAHRYLKYLPRLVQDRLVLLNLRFQVLLGRDWLLRGLLQHF